MAVPDEKEMDEMALNIESFDLLEMLPEEVEATQEAWGLFLEGYESTDAAGEALHDAIIDAAPTLTTLFKMPRAVTAMRFQEGLQQIINTLSEPQDVKNLVFGQNDVGRTVPKMSKGDDGATTCGYVHVSTCFVSHISFLEVILRYFDRRT